MLGMNDKKIVNSPPKHLNAIPLTGLGMHHDIHDKISLITKEFTDGLTFIRDYPKSVTFFGGTRFTEDNPYYKQARSLAGRIVKELGYCVITGGGPGIMEAANRGAFENG